MATGTPEDIAGNPASFTGHYLGPVLADERAHGIVNADRARMERIETENLARLQELATGNRVPIEA